VKKEDLKRSIEFKILTHVSKFTNDLVEKDFLMTSFTNNVPSSKNSKYLPQLRNSRKYMNNSSLNSNEKKYDTRGI